MRVILCCLCLILAALSAPAIAQSETDAPYDLLFRAGTLDDIPKDGQLAYSRVVSNTLEPDTEARDTGVIELSFDGGEPLQASLKFTQGDKYRNLGQFPASVGNPIIMYFVETVVRDMAETAGGSPFYIRNRIKESLISPAELATGSVELGDEIMTAKAVTLRPFDGDPNSDKMKGFGNLVLEVTMSDEVPGWYHTLRAHVPGPEGGALIYSSTLTLDGGGGAE